LAFSIASCAEKPDTVSVDSTRTIITDSKTDSKKDSISQKLKEIENLIEANEKMIENLEEKGE